MHAGEIWKKVKHICEFVPRKSAKDKASLQKIMFLENFQISFDHQNTMNTLEIQQKICNTIVGLKVPPPHLKVFQKIIFWGGARQASLDFTFSSLFVDQIVYILSSGSQEQNLRQIYRLLDDKQVTFTLFDFWFGLVFLGFGLFFLQ